MKTARIDPFKAVFLTYWLLMVSGTLLHSGSLSAAEFESMPEDNGFITELLYLLDGDSFIVGRGLSQGSIRLWGIDAPEYNQPHARRSKQALQHLLENKHLTIVGKDIDKYGRLVALVEVNGVNVNYEMVRTGNAWVHRFYCKDQVCESWLMAEHHARLNRLGIWSSADPVAPWVWKTKK